MKNNINTLNDAELLKIAEEGQDNPLAATNNSMLKFVQTFNLDHGNHPVPVKSLHRLFQMSTGEIIRSDVFSERIGFIFPITKSIVKLNISSFMIVYEIDKLKGVPVKDYKSKHTRAKVEKFINDIGLKPGTFFIKFLVIDVLYRKWRVDNKQKEIKAPVLRELLRLFFEIKRDATGIYFGVDKEILNKLTPEQRLQCLTAKGRKNEEKKQKITS